MTKLGFMDADLKRFKTSIHRPFGIVLVTGPTGSGKTTTLYSALAELNNETENIMTAEDPVEFQLEGVNQVQMKPDVGLDFSAALKSFLRQDPDIILVGEIRDLVTGEIATKAALTGHLVMSTLHTNSAADTIVRLLNMGLEAFNLVSALNCIVAQRLMKTICKDCKVVDTETTPENLNELGIRLEIAKKMTVYRGQGCDVCSHVGTKGRLGVHEVMVIDEDIKKAILANESALEIKRIAMLAGMRSLRQNALRRLAEGKVSAKEVIRSTVPDKAGKPAAKPKKKVA
jgi:type IV pilus assembly protein PilB